MHTGVFDVAAFADKPFIFYIIAEDSSNLFFSRKALENTIGRQLLRGKSYPHKGLLKTKMWKLLLPSIHPLPIKRQKHLKPWDARKKNLEKYACYEKMTVR